MNELDKKARLIIGAACEIANAVPNRSTYRVSKILTKIQGKMDIDTIQDIKGILHEVNATSSNSPFRGLIKCYRDIKKSSKLSRDLDYYVFEKPYAEVLEQLNAFDRQENHR